MGRCSRHSHRGAAVVAHERSIKPNTGALRYYQRRGFVLVAFDSGAVEEARRTIKPEIGLFGRDDISIRDELELELPRAVWPAFIEKYAWPST